MSTFLKPGAPLSLSSPDATSSALPCALWPPFVAVCHCAELLVGRVPTVAQSEAGSLTTPGAPALPRTPQYFPSQGSRPATPPGEYDDAPPTPSFGGPARAAVRALSA